MVFFCICCNCPCDFSAKFCVQAFRICPPSPCLCRAVLPLEFSDPSQCTVHPVFFTGEIDEFSSQDSSVWPHNSTDRIGIDPQIHTADYLIFYRCFCKCYFLRIRKTQEIFTVLFLQCWGRCLFPIPVLPEIFHICMQKPHRKPFPVMAVIQFQLCLIFSRFPFPVHHSAVKNWHGMVFIHKPGLSGSFPFFFP